VKPISEKYGVPIHVYRCPGEESKVVDEVVEKASKEIGEIDIVVVNAGVSMWKDHIDCTDGMSPLHFSADFLEDLNSVITVNLLAPLYLSRSLVRHWLGLPASVTSGSEEKGKREETVNLNKRILMISSISGLVNMTPQKQVAYNASKGGLTMAAKVRHYLIDTLQS